nr:hypothetical protein Iba_chr13cCG14990 [Ipomoea batatas]
MINFHEDESASCAAFSTATTAGTTVSGQQIFASPCGIEAQNISKGILLYPGILESNQNNLKNINSQKNRMHTFDLFSLDSFTRLNSGKFSADASQAGGSSPSSNVHNIKRWRQLCLGNVFAPTAGGLSTGSPPPGGIRTTFIDFAALSSDATSEGVAMQVPTTTAVSLTIESELRVVFVGGFVGGNCAFEGPSAPGLCATFADNCLTSFSRLARAMAWLWDVMDREETVVDNVSILSNCNSKALTDFCKALMADSVFKSVKVLDGTMVVMVREAEIYLDERKKGWVSSHLIEVAITEGQPNQQWLTDIQNFLLVIKLRQNFSLQVQNDACSASKCFLRPRPLPLTLTTSPTGFASSCGSSCSSSSPAEGSVSGSTSSTAFFFFLFLLYYLRILPPPSRSPLHPPPLSSCSPSASLHHSPLPPDSAAPPLLLLRNPRRAVFSYASENSAATAAALLPPHRRLLLSV